VDSIGIAFSGLGEHGLRSHVQPLLDVEGAHIVGAYDPAAACHVELAKLAPGARRYESEQQLLEDPAVQAVIICSPDRFHAPSLAAAVAAGKHVLVEKPLLDELSDDMHLGVLAGVLADARERGLVVSSCHPRRFDPPYTWLRDNLSELTKQLGALMEVRLDFFYHQPSKSGLHHGLLIDHINHEIDLVHFLIGHSPFRARKLADSQVHYAVSGVRADGITFHFNGSRHLTERLYPETAQLRFERGVATVDTGKGLCEVRDFDRQRTSELVCGRTDYTQRFAAVNENFVRACQGAANPYLSADDLLVNTEIGIALTFADADDPLGVYSYAGGLMQALRSN
jgi:predicted dehydrogenase